MGWFEKALIIFYGVGIPLAFICSKIDEKSEKEKKEREEKIRREQPFSCPFCGTKTFIRMMRTDAIPALNAGEPSFTTG